MKIQNINAMALEQMAKNEISESADQKGTEKVFRSHLTNEREAAYFDHIKGLIGEIEAQGVRLTKRADMSELQKYREMITKLLNETVSNGFAFQKEGKMGLNGRSKIFVVIKKINTKLDEMTQKVLSEEKDNINFLSDVDDIRGLLVDMFF